MTEEFHLGSIGVWKKGRRADWKYGRMETDQ
jgi:hypothetical protein